MSFYIFPRSSAASSGGWWSSQFTIWASGVFLLRVSVKGRVAQVGLITVLAFMVSTVSVVLAPSAASLQMVLLHLFASDLILSEVEVLIAEVLSLALTDTWLLY